MRMLDRKLCRDLWHLRGQALAIAAVMACGVALLIMARTSMEALSETRDAYYERYDFADVFASARRAPDHVGRQIAAIPGVRGAELRVVELSTVTVEGFEEPIVGQLVSLPDHRAPILNRLVLRSGRTIDPGRIDEVLVNEPFAEAHHLTIGDTIRLLLNGQRRTMRIVGTALSPEFVYAIGPGQLMPDNERFGIFWMSETALDAAYDTEGAFNNLVLALDHAADIDAVIAKIDALLAPYGGTGAYARADQISNFYVSNEIEQHRNMSAILPSLFFAVAAFLLNLSLGRLIATERGSIGLLKAFGYGNGAIALHYVKLVALIAGLGVALGIIVGYVLGRYHTGLYVDLFAFPELIYRPRAGTFGMVALISLAIALLATLGAVLQAARLPPAEALRPPAPSAYRRTWLTRTVARHLFDQPTRIILRQIYRFPVRSLLQAMGIGLAVSMLVIVFQWRESVDQIINTFFLESQRQTATIGFAEPTDVRALHDVAHLPGVLQAEPIRVVAARLTHGLSSKRQSIEGVSAVPQLSLVRDQAGTAYAMPGEGLVISTALAERLGVSRGDRLQVEVLEGRRPIVDLPVVATFETYVGTPAYMSIDALNRVMQEPGTVSGIHLRVDALAEPALYRELRDVPKVSAVAIKRAAIDRFNETMAEVINIFLGFIIAFACTLSFGVVYSAARIALSERGRDLATLRVLGFSRWQISYILLGELGLLAIAGLPLGVAAGYGLQRLIASAIDTELYRVPLIIDPYATGLAVAIGLGAVIGGGLLVRRRLDHLDMVAVLKSRE